MTTVMRWELGPAVRLIFFIIQIKWLNDYHATCLQVVGDYLKEKGKADVLGWLQRETQPIKQWQYGTQCAGYCRVCPSVSSEISISLATWIRAECTLHCFVSALHYILTSGATPLEMMMDVFCMFGTTLPTDGTGLVMRGDIEGMLASWDNRVTPPLDTCWSLSPPSM
jgi:hypothetical protein